MGSLSGVQPLMVSQTVGVPQRFPTVATKKASLSVAEHVPLEIRLLSESLQALRAVKGFLPAVDPQMALQVP